MARGDASRANDLAIPYSPERPVGLPDWPGFQILATSGAGKVRLPAALPGGSFFIASLALWFFARESKGLECAGFSLQWGLRRPIYRA